MQRRPSTETDRDARKRTSVSELSEELATLPPTITDSGEVRSRLGQKRILVIDDRSFRRESVVGLLREISPDNVFTALARPRDFVAGAPYPGDGEAADIVILDIGSTRLPDERVASDIEYLGECFGDIPVILLSDREDSSQVVEALNCGVRGFIPTTLGSRVVAEAVRLVVAGGTFIPASALIHALSGTRETYRDGRNRGGCTPDVGLTPREVDVLNLLREGKPNKIIAADLDLKETTVKIHVRHIMKKLKATNRTEAALMAERAL